MEAIKAAIEGNKQEQKTLEEEKKALSQMILRNEEKPPLFEEVVTAFEQNPYAALEKYRPIRDRVLQRNQDEKRLREIKNRLHELFVQLLEHQNTQTKIAKQNAAEECIGQFEGLNEGELIGRAVGLNARRLQYSRFCDPHDDNTLAEKLTETKLDAIEILLKRKNIDVIYTRGEISFSGESRGKSCKVARK